MHKHNENAKFTNAIFIEMHEMQACDQKLKILNTNIAYCRTLEQTAFKITLSTKFFWNYIHSKYPHKPNDLNKLRWALSVPRHPKRIVPGKLKVCCNWHIARALPLKQKMHLKSKPLKLPDCICDLRWVSHLQHFCNFSSGKQIPAVGGECTLVVREPPAGPKKLT